MYSVAASLKYDKLFRQAEAKNKQQSLRLDAVKTCWFWRLTNPPFRTRQQPSANPQIGTSTGASATHSEATSGSHHHVEHATHTPSDEEVCLRFNPPREQDVPSPTCICWVTGCGVEHPAKPCPRATPGTR